LNTVDISIIIPTYNRLWCLPQAVESCRNTVCKTEIIVIDDGSTDGTLAWLQQQTDITIIKQEHWGKCWAVNAGFEVAKGQYIRFLDSDDIIDPGANDGQFKLAEQVSADIVVSGYKLFSTENIFVKTQQWVECDDFVAQQLGECDASHYSAYLFKRDFLNDIPHRPDFALRDDRLLVLEAALKNPVVVIHPGTALLHRIDHAGRLQVSAGLKQDVQHFQQLNIYKYILPKLQADGQLTQRRIDAAIKVLWPLCTWIAKSHLQDAVDLYEWILTLKPEFTIPEKGITGMLYKNTGFAPTQKLLSTARFLKYRWK
jgi:glycosyltransferase involved in cell wall biosynthesis